MLVLSGTTREAREFIGLLAQLVEQQTLNLQVRGSSPRRPIYHCKSGGIGRRAGLRSQSLKEGGGSSPPSCI